MQAYYLITGPDLAIDGVVIGIVLQGAGGEAEHAHDVVMRRGRVVVDQHAGGAVDGAIEHGHLLQGGKQLLGGRVVLPGQRGGHAGQPGT